MKEMEAARRTRRPFSPIKAEYVTMCFCKRLRLACESRLDRKLNTEELNVSRVAFSALIELHKKRSISSGSDRGLLPAKRPHLAGTQPRHRLHRGRRLHLSGRTSVM